MDLIHQCLAIVPIPALQVAFTVFKSVWDGVQNSKASKERLKVLAQCVAELLTSIHRQFEKRKLRVRESATAMGNLVKLLEEISEFVEKHCSYGFVKSFIIADDRNLAIEGYHRRISACVYAFQLSALVNIQDWQKRHDVSRETDRKNLQRELEQLQTDKQRLIETLKAQEENVAAILCALHKKQQTAKDEVETKFITNSLRILTTWSGRQVEVEQWTVTSFEIETGPTIGSGGFGLVRKGTWNRVEVAIKYFKTAGVANPDPKAITKEVRILAKLRHPHIIQFLGANVLDNDPFILMPYCKNGHSRSYVEDNPTCDRLKILYDAALGLMYLHSQNIVHGDIKAMNILIDDSLKAVLCDFGLSHIKADVSTRTALVDPPVLMGSRNWMAPERLLGKKLRISSDIYSLAMTIHEIYALESPFFDLPPSDLRDLVVNHRQRPERPDPEDCQEGSGAVPIPDDLWEVVQDCWAHEVNDRPTADIVCERLMFIIQAHPVPTPPAVAARSSARENSFSPFIEFESEPADRTEVFRTPPPPPPRSPVRVPPTEPVQRQGALRPPPLPARPSPSPTPATLQVQPHTISSPAPPPNSPAGQGGWFGNLPIPAPSRSHSPIPPVASSVPHGIPPYYPPSTPQTVWEATGGSVLFQSPTYAPAVNNAAGGDDIHGPPEDPWDFGHHVTAIRFIDEDSYGDAERMLLYILELCDKKLGNMGKIPSWSAIGILTLLYWKQFRFEEAGRMITRMVVEMGDLTNAEIDEAEDRLRKLKRWRDELHPECCHLADAIASAHGNKGKTDLQITLLRTPLRGFQQHYGARHFFTLAIEETLRGLEAAKEAEATGSSAPLEKYFEFCKTTFGPDHFLASMAAHRLIRSYVMANPQKAISVGNGVLYNLRRQIGYQHIVTLMFAAFVGIAHLNIGQAREAISNLEPCVCGMERIFPIGDARTQEVALQLALAYTKTGRSGEAMVLFSRYGDSTMPRNPTLGGQSVSSNANVGVANIIANLFGAGNGNNWR